MAKRQERLGAALTDLFAKTEGGGPVDVNAVPAEGYTRSTSVGLRQSEIDILDHIAEAEGVARNAIMRYLLRWAMAEYAAGRLTIPTSEERTRRVEMP